MARPGKPISTSAQPKLIWRPKIPLHPSVFPDGNKSSPTNKSLDSHPDMSFDDNFQSVQSNDSSTDSDASSVPNEERAQFIAAQRHCAMISLFHRKEIPETSSFGPPPIAMRPILIDRAIVQDHIVVPEAPYTSSGLEIVPWHPVNHAIALQLWPVVVSILRTVAKGKQIAPEPAPVIIITQDGVVTSPPTSGPTIFEFQSEEIQPSLVAAVGQIPNIVREKRKNMCLPDVVSSSDARTPLAQKSVRRSKRCVNKEGFCYVRLEKEPSKRTKNWLVEIDPITGKPGPVSLSVLQDWGVKCGVDPSDLTDDALMQAPGPAVPDEEPED